MTEGWWFGLVPVPSDYRLVEAIQRSLYEAAGEPETYDLATPHLTVHPGLICDKETAGRVVKWLDGLAGRAWNVEGLGFYPSAEEPSYPLLHVDVSVVEAREMAVDIAEAFGGRAFRHPAPPHVTLLKYRYAGEEPPDGDDSHERVSEAIGDRAGDLGGWEMTFASAFAREATVDED